MKKKSTNIPESEKHILENPNSVFYDGEYIAALYFYTHDFGMVPLSKIQEFGSYCNKLIKKNYPFEVKFKNSEMEILDGCHFFDSCFEIKRIEENAYIKFNRDLKILRERFINELPQEVVDIILKGDKKDAKKSYNDLRIDTERLFTFKDMDTAREHIGEEVYLFNVLEDLMHILEDEEVAETYKVRLAAINYPSTTPFISDEDSEDVDTKCYEYMYLIPEGRRPNYRPFKWSERLILRNEGWVKSKDDEEEFQIVRMNYDTFGTLYVFLGNCTDSFTADELLEYFTFLDGDPCGIALE